MHAGRSRSHLLFLCLQYRQAWRAADATVPFVFSIKELISSYGATRRAAGGIQGLYSTAWEMLGGLERLLWLTNLFLAHKGDRRIMCLSAAQTNGLSFTVFEEVALKHKFAVKVMPLFFCSCKPRIPLCTTCSEPGNAKIWTMTRNEGNVSSETKTQRQNLGLES